MRIINVDGTKEKEFILSLKKRSQETDQEVAKKVTEIIENVKEKGDQALKEYTLMFDGFLPEKMEISRKETEEAFNSLEPALKEALIKACDNIRDFHRRQLREGFTIIKEDGIILGQKVRGLKRVGIYVPGGLAAYPSTVLMNAVPAKIAGVEEIIMITLPQKKGKVNKTVLAAAYLAGVDRIYLAGGAQGVAALAFGTETIPAVDKIVGPGNIFVATAKKLLYGKVDIDMIAGPSEVLILADNTANPDYVAADLMSQAEHDPMASAMLVTNSDELSRQVEASLYRQAAGLERRNIIMQSIENYGAVFLTKDIDQAVDLANQLAPEHLEVMVDNPFKLLGRLHNAGSIFIGRYTPEPLGDYYAGPNHILPTGGTARFYSPVGVDTFMKFSSVIYYSKNAIEQDAERIIKLAEVEGLTAHANSIRIRKGKPLNN